MSNNKSERNESDDAKTYSLPSQTIPAPTSGPMIASGAHGPEPSTDDARPALGLFLSFLSCLFFSFTAVIVKSLKPVRGAQVLLIR